MRCNIEAIESSSIKIFRDDLYPFLGGGNKGRKMDYIAQDVLKKKSGAVVTTGGFQSNHARAVAVFAAQNNIACTLVLHGSKKEFELQSGNAKIMRLSGARIIFVDEASEIGQAMDDAMEDYQKENLRPYYIWGGGHTLEGGLAYIDAVQILKNYSDETRWEPDYIFLASGTGSTQAGILAGLDKFNFKNTEVIGISVGRTRAKAEKIVDEFYSKLCDTYKIEKSDRKVVVLDDYLMGGYGCFNSDLKSLSLNSLKNYGFTLDTCYTAKAFYGMKDYINNKNIHDKRILFWHTGGVFNFLAE